MANLWPTSLWPRVSATSVLEDTQTPFLSVASFLAAIVAVDAVVAARRSTTTSHTHTHTHTKEAEKTNEKKRRTARDELSVGVGDKSVAPTASRSAV